MEIALIAGGAIALIYYESQKQKKDDEEDDGDRSGADKDPEIVSSSLKTVPALPPKATGSNAPSDPVKGNGAGGTQPVTSPSDPPRVGPPPIPDTLSQTFYSYALVNNASHTVRWSQPTTADWPWTSPQVAFKGKWIGGHWTGTVRDYQGRLNDYKLNWGTNLRDLSLLPQPKIN